MMSFLSEPFIFAGDTEPKYCFGDNTQNQEKRCRTRRARRIQRDREDQEQECDQMSFHCYFCSGPSGLAAQPSGSIE